jgi:hypothetical protein
MSSCAVMPPRYRISAGLALVHARRAAAAANAIMAWNGCVFCVALGQSCSQVNQTSPNRCVSATALPLAVLTSPLTLQACLSLCALQLEYDIEDVSKEGGGVGKC